MIFEEFIVVYSYWSFLGKGNYVILYVCMVKYEFVYWINDKGIQVVIDNEMIGIIKSNDVLYGVKFNCMLV